MKVITELPVATVVTLQHIEHEPLTIFITTPVAQIQGSPANIARIAQANLNPFLYFFYDHDDHVVGRLDLSPVIETATSALTEELTP